MTTHQHLSRRTLLGATASAAAVAGLSPLAAMAQSGTVRFILPNATGSGVDAITRAAQGALGKALNAAVVVDNQPGAGGVVGLQALAKAAPDGNTLAVVSNNVVIFPSVLKSLPFDMPGDFTPIAVVGATPMVLVVNAAKVPATNMREFVALLKSKPGQLNFASGGNGTILHLATELFLDASGATAKHIPYKGVGPMVTDLIGGQVDFATAALPSVQAHLKSGTLRAIGVASAQRTPAAPEIPTFAEQGLPNYVVEAWFAVIGPKGLPAAEVRRAHDAVAAAFAAPEVKALMAQQGNVVHVGSPEAAQAFFQHGGVGLELDGLAVAGRSQARLVEHFVQEAGQVVRQRVGVAVLEGQHFGVVERFDRVAIQLLAARGGALGLGLFFGRQGFLGAELGNDGFALVRALDVHTGVFKIAHGHAVERQARGQPHLFIVLAFVHLQALAHQGRAHGAHQLGRVGFGGFFPFLDLDVRQQKRVGAVFVAAVHAQQLAPLQVVEQRGLIVLRLGRGFQLGQGSRNAAGAACRLHIAGQLVVALHAGATGQGRAQGQYPQQTGAKVRKSFHFFPTRTMYGMSESPAAPTARYQPKLTSALLRAPKRADKVRVASGER